MILRKTFRFEASHILPKHPGKCSRLHGHSWVLHVEVSGPINADSGFVMDYSDISKWTNPVIDRLDHRHLGQWFDHGRQEAIPTELRFSEGVGTSHKVNGMSPGFYPSSENLLHWIGLQLIEFPWSSLTLEETCTSSATLSREEFNRDAASH